MPVKMCKSVAILLLIITFGGAEENQQDQAGSTSTPTMTDGKDNEYVEKTNTGPADTHTLVNDADEEERQPVQLGSVTTSTVNIHEPDNDEGKRENSSSSLASSESQEAVTEGKKLIMVKSEDKLFESSEETKELRKNVKDDTGLHGGHWQVSTHCLDCLCSLTTGCNLTTLQKGCRGGTCGPFGISYVFWEDARDHKHPDGPSFEGDAKMENEWRGCSLDLLCSSETIQKYFHKYPHDCNEDGKVDCLDYAAIHTLGPFGCQKKDRLNDWNLSGRKRQLLQCLTSNEEGAYTKKMLELQSKLESQDIAARNLQEKETYKNTNDIPIVQI